jgi:hypothetical protein
MLLFSIPLGGGMPQNMRNTMKLLGKEIRDIQYRIGTEELLCISARVRPSDEGQTD